ncbi:MAG: hypothetical protein ABMA14_06305, partial [Hyphomonadaceae bacterium]
DFSVQYEASLILKRQHERRSGKGILDEAWAAAETLQDHASNYRRNYAKYPNHHMRISPIALESSRLTRLILYTNEPPP